MSYLLTVCQIRAFFLISFVIFAFTCDHFRFYSFDDNHLLRLFFFSGCTRSKRTPWTTGRTRSTCKKKRAIDSFSCIFTVSFLIFFLYVLAILYGNMVLKTVRVLHSFGVMSVYESSTDGNFVDTVLWFPLKKLLLRECLFSSCGVVV